MSKAELCDKTKTYPEIAKENSRNFTKHTDNILVLVSVVSEPSSFTDSNNVTSKIPAPTNDTISYAHDYVMYSQTHLISHGLISQSAYCHINFYPRPTPVIIKRP